MTDVSCDNTDVPSNIQYSIYEGKLLIQRYRVKDHNFRNKYATFCNSLQMPGLFHIHPGGMAPEAVKPPRQIHHRCFPSLYDYFGLSIQKPHDISIDPASRFLNFIDLNRHMTTEDGSNNYLSIWSQIFNEQNPSFFIIQSNLMIETKDGSKSSWFEMEHYVPVIRKGDHYYVCPGEEGASVYRVLHLNELFFTTTGHNVLEAILRKSFGNDRSVSGIELKLPRGPEWSVCNLWDETNMTDIVRLSQFPVTNTSAVPDFFHTVVQVVDLNDDENITDISMKDEDEDDFESVDSPME